MADDARFMAALQFTAYYTVIVTVAIFAVAFPLALFVEKQRRFVTAYRTIIFLPVVVGLASASLLWVWLANVDCGFIPRAMVALGLVERPPNLMAKFDTAFAVIIVMVVWKIAGFTMIILLTGLQAIPPELVEAARIDGAGPLAALPAPDAAPDAQDHRAGARRLGDRLDPRLRPVLHHDQRAARRTG